MSTPDPKRPGKACAQVLTFHRELKTLSDRHMGALHGSNSSRLLVKVLFRVHFFTLIREGDAIIEYLGQNPDYVGYSTVLHRMLISLRNVLPLLKDPYS